MVLKRVFSGILFIVLLLSCAGNVYAQITPIPTDAPGVSAWRFDPVTTEVGKRAERARQFVNWVITHPSIDNHAVFRRVWLVSAGVTFFLILITVMLMGIGLLVAKRRDISVKVDVTPIIGKIVVLLVYTAFSYWIVLGLIQASDILMQFFIKLLNADKLFRIFFATSSEEGYRNFIGYRDFDPLKLEMVKTSWFVIDVSSYTYFVMGILVVLRKVVLWFLLIVAPFLALLIPFRLIRNTGWIWIGVFFQWAFYGPLFALFLGALTLIWSTGIPYRFDFSRIVHGTTANPDDKVVYPLSINILYGGPQQAPAPALGSPLSSTEGVINTSNYVDTFAEYIISLIMLWVVMILPWWLLRIFRDYCCEGIYAMKNILLNMLEQQTHGPSPSPTGPAPAKQNFQRDRSEHVREETLSKAVMQEMRDIKTMDVSEISKKMDIQIEKLSDIARLETKSDRKEYVHSVMEKMRNPMAAENKDERSQFTKLKTELSERAVKGDTAAQRLLNATTSTSTSVRQAIQSFAQSKPQTVSYIQNVSQTLNISQQDVQNITQSMVNEVSSNKQAVTNIANTSNVSEAQAAQVLQSIPRAVAQSQSTDLVQTVATNTGITNEKTNAIMSKAAERVQTNEIAKQVAARSNAKVDQVKRVAQEVLSKPVSQKVSAPAELIARPASMSIDEYEEIKKMWTDHYRKGEVPVSETVKTREDWVAKDIVSLNNTLNKLISDNEEVRAAGLQEVADIIPFFMLGNMNMQDIAAYLKAKVAAAGDVQSRMTEIEGVQQELSAKVEEQFVDVEKQAEAVKEQTLHLENEIKESNESNGQEPVLRGEVTSPGMTVNQGINREQFESILKKMDVQITKLSDIVRAQTQISQAQVKNTEDAQTYKNLVTQSSLAVQEKIQQFAQLKPQTTSYGENIAQNLHLSAQEVKGVTESLVKEVSGSAPVVNAVALGAGVTPDQAQKVLQSISTALDQSQPTTVVASVATAAGVSPDKAAAVLSNTAQKVQISDAVNRVATQTSVSAQNVQKVADAVLVNPTGNKSTTPGELVARPESMSIDEYEEIKHMWVDHYTQGEVPVSDTVKTRTDWIQKDVISLNNTLNKLVSENEEIRAQGLQEVADIIPFFMLGNMNTQDIAVYLKAKVAAAQETSEQLAVLSQAQNTTQQVLEEQLVDAQRITVNNQQSTVNEQRIADDESIRRGEVTSPGISVTSGIDREQFESMLKKMDVQISKLSDIARAQVQLSRSDKSHSASLQSYKDLVTQSSVAVTQKINDLSKQSVIPSVVEEVTNEVHAGPGLVERVVSSVITEIIKDTAVTQTIATATQASNEVVRSVLTTLPVIVNQRGAAEIIPALAEKSQASVDVVTKILEKVIDKQVLEKVATAVSQKETVNNKVIQEITTQTFSPRVLEERKKKHAAKPLDMRSQILAQQKFTDKQKPMGLDEYEEIKRMWVEHYANGEVPMSATITSRLIWVQQDSIFLTNVLNQVASTNEEVRAQGLKAVAEIIPFFMVADMTLQDINLYLRAKCAAAIEVKDGLEKEEELKQLLGGKVEEFADAQTTNNEQKAQEMKINDQK